MWWGCDGVGCDGVGCDGVGCGGVGCGGGGGDGICSNSGAFALAVCAAVVFVFFGRVCVSFVFFHGGADATALAA